ncbi:glutamate-gated chloride channel-like [Eriocheir sinensis]|uniref:glutamate-gated chloride channel-like n=1 Tax=Eriocheir sinensis TaxID=95602 RepID=UPI0021C79B4D|nr:glutamate-gated chloride channel-like [Eriocheir sinensis]
MAAGGFLLTLLLLLVASEGLEATAAEDRATKEISNKLHGGDYDKMIRPPGTGGTTVSLQVYFRDIDIDDIKMKANFDITFRMLWNDTRLAYNDMPGLEGVSYVSLLDPYPLWLPDAFFKNAKVTQYSSIHPEQYLRVYPDGHIVFSTRIKLQNSCPMNLRRFPHDTQVCDIKIASYGYTTKDIKLLLPRTKAVTFGSDIHADRFKFEKSYVDTCNSITSTGEYSCVQVSMKIRRHFGSYLIESYIPTMFLVVVAWFSFLIPTKQFLGRILLTLIPLIALASFSSNYKKSLASVPYATAMDTFNGISLCVIFLTLVYVILCHVYDNKKEEGEEKPAASAEDGEVAKGGEAEGGWMRRLARRARKRANYLSRVLLVSGYSFFLFVYFVAFCGTG